ncbi:MAG: ATP-binding cassette domain-containing protein [Candidatus Thiodiazotropha taylori]
MLSYNRVYKKYPGNNFEIKNVSFEAESGSLTAIVGSSGCGKSTLLQLAAALELPDKGNVTIEDISAQIAYSKNNIRLGYVFQDASLYPRFTIEDNLLFYHRVHNIEADLSSSTYEQVCDAFGLVPHLNKLPHQLSGGELQRAAIARCVLRQPQVALFDEPLSNLDLENRRIVRKAILEAQATQAKSHDAVFIVVMHDDLELLEISDKVILMKDGEIVQDGTFEQIQRHPESEYCISFFAPFGINSLPIEAFQNTENTSEDNICNYLTNKLSDLNKRLSKVIFRYDALKEIPTGIKININIISSEKAGLHRIITGRLPSGFCVQAVVSARYNSSGSALLYIAPDDIYLF